MKYVGSLRYRWIQIWTVETYDMALVGVNGNADIYTSRGWSSRVSAKAEAKRHMSFTSARSLFSFGEWV
jgi:hypothetical protein